MRIRSARAGERARRSEALKRGAIGAVLDGTRLLVLQRGREPRVLSIAEESWFQESARSIRDVSDSFSGDLEVC